MDFTAIDVETANANMASICQIGVATFSADMLTDEWKTYVDPEDFFDPMNVYVHGITQETVAKAPTFLLVADVLLSLLDGRTVVSHTSFDRVSLHQACAKNALEEPDCVWLDSARIARRAWTQFSRRGYGLENLCEHIGYEFEHHDALEDAKAAGQVVLAAIETTNLSIDELQTRTAQPVDSRAVEKIKREGNPEGPLFGEVIVFTGALQIPRRDAAELAANAGCEVGANVTKHTTMLVVGDQDVMKLAGHLKSSKHRKAESLISKGQAIRILRETDFVKLVALF